ncbi:signal transduction histidine kinase [Mycetocola sp. CAN_C7]|uniref:sensor histidine kinase n=1 Tax=Mycetocola sp. CAN_C7 TaxID=2787724 RepID=UPI001A21570B
MSTDAIEHPTRTEAGSATLGSMNTHKPAPQVPSPPPAARGYGGLWRNVPRELGFLLLTLPIALTGFTIMVSLFSAGLGMIALVVGIFVVVASLYVARGFGLLELLRLRAAGHPSIAAPEWPRAGGDAGFWRTALGPVANGHYWTYLLHGLVINPIVSIVSWTVTVTWLATGVGGVSYWFWARFIPEGDPDRFWLSGVVFEFFFPGRLLGVDRFTSDALFNLVAGVIFVVTLPFITRWLTLLHHVIARGLLSRWQSDDLRREVAALDASRGAALQAEDQSVRRLERDIHDGPQQRLVRLQMDLAAAERRLDTEPDAARILIGEARQQAQASLEELRALSRGFAPPILGDRGLVSAIESLATVSSIPVTVHSSLAPRLRLPAEIERNGYFVAAELITNASKHSGASTVTVDVSMHPAEFGQLLTVTVSDDGIGGAHLTSGHGLQGLRDRLHGLRGTLTIDSPAGAGTRATASVPFA